MNVQFTLESKESGGEHYRLWNWFSTNCTKSRIIMGTLTIKQSHGGIVQPLLQRSFSSTWQSCPLKSFKWGYAGLL